MTHTMETGLFFQNSWKFPLTQTPQQKTLESFGVFFPLEGGDQTRPILTGLQSFTSSDGTCEYGHVAQAGSCCFPVGWGRSLLKGKRLVGSRDPTAHRTIGD